MALLLFLFRGETCGGCASSRQFLLLLLVKLLVAWVLPVYVVLLRMLCALPKRLLPLGWLQL